MVRLIDRRSTEERHDECFHQELERDAERDAHGQVAGPTLGPNVSDVAPWRARPLDPQEHENGAEGRHGIVPDERNGEHREDPEGSESSQPRPEPIDRRACDYGVDGGLRMRFRQWRAPVLVVRLLWPHPGARPGAARPARAG